jgi:hypothetical protein
MTESNQEQCVCDKKVDMEENCPICSDKFMTVGDMECPIHKFRVWCGGFPIDTCPTCKSKRFKYVSSSYGGPPYIHNEKLHEKYYVDTTKKLPPPYISSYMDTSDGKRTAVLLTLEDIFNKNK